MTLAFVTGVVLTLLVVLIAQGWRWSAAPSRLELNEPGSRVDLNRADRLELSLLPGVGAALATRIEMYREDHGGFRSLDELQNVPGIGPAVVARLRPWVTLSPVPRAGERQERGSMGERRPVIRMASADPDDRPPDRLADRPPAKSSGKPSPRQPIDPNRAGPEDLQLLPGIGPKTAQKIIDERERRPFARLEDLRRVSGIGPKKLEQLRPYLVFRPEPRVAAAE